MKWVDESFYSPRARVTLRECNDVVGYGYRVLHLVMISLKLTV
jgi:hypothetical protein